MLALLLFLTLQVSPGTSPSQQPPIPHDHEAIHREMDELFKQIELRQRAMDRMLYDASAGEKLAQRTAGSGIGELIHRTRDHGRDVQRDIQRILDLAASHTHQSGGT